MRRQAITLAIICLAMVRISFSQLSVNAGPDRVVCVPYTGIEIISIGGDPAVTGGTPPYTFAWEAEHTWSIGDHVFNYSASDFLSDTTLANPEVVNSIEDNLVFYLTVTDSLGVSGTDSTVIYFAHFGTHLGYVDYHINQGDSVLLSGFENVFGGYPPYEYLWRPNEGLTDSTSLSFWAKPNHSVAYYLTLTDSSGCVVTGAPVYHVQVSPLSVEELNGQSPKVKVYPNPVESFLKVAIDPQVQGIFTIRIFDNTGKLLKQREFRENNTIIGLSDYTSGVYIYEVSNDKDFIEQGQVVKK